MKGTMTKTENGISLSKSPDVLRSYSYKYRKQMKTRGGESIVGHQRYLYLDSCCSFPEDNFIHRSTAKKTPKTKTKVT